MKTRRNQSQKRTSHNRRPRRRFYIFSEGKNTEKDYFKCLEIELGHRGTMIDYHGPLGVPKSVTEKAIEFARGRGLVKTKGRRRKKLDSYEENDEVWAVFDRDEHPAFKEAIEDCRGAGVPFAYSDPCFELWLLLHLLPYDAPCHRHKVQKELRRQLNGYDHNSGKTADFGPLIESLESAEDRAERQRDDRRKEGMEDGNPSTNVYELTRAIKHAGNPDEDD